MRVADRLFFNRNRYSDGLNSPLNLAIDAGDCVSAIKRAFYLHYYTEN